MSGSEKVNLSEIANISEDEFKKQLLAWIDNRGVSRTLQSKLRAELFEHFNRTQLGRQIAVQHQKSHRIELSPLVLVLNTLVAEFLYAENCHFSLSVFSAEVPYKNTLPDFEAVTAAVHGPFRLSERELKDIIEAIGMSKSNAKTIQKFYASIDNGNGEGRNAMGKSLLYCIFKIMLTGTGVKDKTNAADGVEEVTKEPIVNVDTNSSAKCANCSLSEKKFKKYQISSRYFKYLNRYLDILSERVRDMSQSLAEIHSENPLKRKSVAESSAALESNLKKALDRIIENVNHLTKSKRKSKKLTDFLQSIDRLSTNLEVCASNMARLLVTVTNECGDLKRPRTESEKMGNSVDVDYCTWLQELKTSGNGRRFVARLEASLQKTLAKEQETIERVYKEKMETYRMLIKCHYKQKYAKNGKGSHMDASITKSVEAPKQAKKGIASIDSNQVLLNTLKHAATEKEEYVDRIMQTAKLRLQQLENESEKLDKSFQTYLKQQTTQKIQLNEDITNIWQDYTFGKVLLERHSLTTPRKALLSQQKSTMDSNRMLAAEIDALTQVESTNEFENPFKQFASEKLFPKRRPSSAVTKNQNKAAIKTIDFDYQLEMGQLESLPQTISSESSYGQLPSPKRNGFKENSKIPSQEKSVAPVANQNAGLSERKNEDNVNPKNSENDANGVKMKIPLRENTEIHRKSSLTDIGIIQMPAVTSVPVVSSLPALSSMSTVSSAPIVSSIVAVSSLPAMPMPSVEAKEIDGDVKPAVSNLPLSIREYVSADHDSVTDDELDESLEISIGPHRDASSSDDAWN